MMMLPCNARRTALLLTRAFLFALICWIAGPDRLEAQNRVTLIGHIDVPHGTSGQNTQYSNCWGWVSPDGREYALLGTYRGTSIIDINGDSLKEVAFIPGPTAQWAYREIKTYKQYAYIVSEGGAGVQIVDMSGLPDTAILVKNFIYVHPPQPNLTVERSHTVTLADGYLYCNGSVHWSPGGMVIFSLRNDPTTPEFVHAITREYIHDSYARNDTLYGAAINGGGLTIYDVSDKASPVLLGAIEYPGSITHNAWASIDGKYAFTTDEGFGGQRERSMKVWALDSLPKAVQVSEYSADPVSIVHNVHGRGNYAYVSFYTAGMRVVDVRDPRNISEAGFYDTFPGADGGFAGCWGIYPYFPSGKWIGSDMQSGLYVCRFDSLLPRSRSALLAPADNVPVAAPEFRWTSAARQMEDPHYYDVHIVGPGVDSLFTTTDTSLALPSGLPLQSGQSYRWHVMIRDEYTEVSSRDTLHFIYTGSTSDVQGEELPDAFALAQNYPNPFNPITKISFALDEAAAVTLTVYDQLGRVAALLLENQLLAPGVHEVAFDGSTLASGVYHYRLSAPRGAIVKRMVLSR